MVFKLSFYRVAVDVIDRYHGDASSELVILGQVLCAIGSGPPTEMISDSSSASVPASSTFLLASSLATALRTMGGSGGNWSSRDTLISGAAPEPSARRLLSPLTTTRLFFFPSDMMNNVACFQLLHGAFTILFNNYHDYLISKLTDLSASNNVSMIFQGNIEESNSRYPQFKTSSLVCLPFINFSFTAN